MSTLVPSGFSSGANRTQRNPFFRWLSNISFISPALFFFTLLILLPTILSIYYSFTNYTGMGTPIKLIGLKHFQALLKDVNFYAALKDTLLWSFIYTVTSVIGGLALALLLSANLYLRNLFRVAIYHPVALSFVVIGLLWKWIYLPDNGILNTLLRSIGLDNLAKPWLGNQSTALISIIIAASWQQISYCMVLYLAGLATIPQEYIEAASIDGASKAQSIRYIVVPLLARVTAVAAVTTILKSFKVFDLVFVMTFGGPGRATLVLPFFAYIEAFRHYRMAYASAVSVISVIIILPIIIFYVRYITEANNG